jgi:small GTP-binding protein
MNEIIKIVVLGETYVGKSCLCNTVTKGDFILSYNKTIGIDYKTVDIVINNRIISICLWDLSGDDRFQFMFDSFVDSNNVLFFLYSAENRESFINMKKIFERYMSHNFLKNKKIIVIATKIDSYNCYPDYEKDGIEFTKLYNYFFIKTSSKTKYGIQDIINTLYTFIPPRKNILENTKSIVTTNKKCCLM